MVYRGAHGRRMRCNSPHPAVDRARRGARGIRFPEDERLCSQEQFRHGHNGQPARNQSRRMAYAGRLDVAAGRICCRPDRVERERILRRIDRQCDRRKRHHPLDDRARAGGNRVAPDGPRRSHPLQPALRQQHRLRRRLSAAVRGEHLDERHDLGERRQGHEHRRRRDRAVPSAGRSLRADRADGHRHELVVGR